jgi:Ca-activated chloride channel family protein
MTLSFTVRSDRSLIRAAARSTRYVLVRITAPAAPPRDHRLPINTALVLDRSGSMADDRKFTLARQAVEQALRMLRPEDRFSLVVYDNVVDVLAPSVLATVDAKRRALSALAHIEPRNSTDLGSGWFRGCEQMAEHLRDGQVSRCLLLTDGLANQGITDRSELAMHAGELRRRGIATSTFGVGADFDERLLRDMAHEGGGNFYFIEGAAQIPEMLTGELGEALEVTLRGAALEVALPRGAEARPLNRFRFGRAAGDNELRVELGDLVSEQELAAVLEVTFPRGEVGARSGVRIALSTNGALLPAAESEVTWTYANHEENDRQPRDREVDREVAALYAARARAEATEANRAGDFGLARRVLERTAERIRSYAGNDPELGLVRAQLLDEVPRFAEHMMDARAMKRAFFEADAATRFRDTSGKARRKQ